MKISIILLFVFICVFNYNCYNVEQIVEETNGFVLELPKELYGKWEIIEYVNGRFVGRLNSPEILYDTFELQEKYITYNGEQIKNPHISYIKKNLSYYDIIKERYQANNLGMTVNDYATIIYIAGDDTGKEKGWYIDILYTNRMDLYVLTSTDQAGKAKKIS